LRIVSGKSFNLPMAQISPSLFQRTRNEREKFAEEEIIDEIQKGFVISSDLLICHGKLSHVGIIEMQKSEQLIIVGVMNNL
jgi:hypothetical protein